MRSVKVTAKKEGETVGLATISLPFENLEALIERFTEEQTFNFCRIGLGRQIEGITRKMLIAGKTEAEINTFIMEEWDPSIKVTRAKRTGAEKYAASIEGKTPEEKNVALLELLEQMDIDPQELADLAE